MLCHQGNIDILQIIGGVEQPLIMHQLTCNCNGVLKGIRICMRGFPIKSHGGKYWIDQTKVFFRAGNLAALEFGKKYLDLTESIRIKILFDV